VPHKPTSWPLAPLLGGLLLEQNDVLPAEGLQMTTALGDLGRAFIPKGGVGRHYRAVSRNGRVLLATDRPLEECGNRIVWLRIACSHRQILSDDESCQWGVLLVAWTPPELSAAASPRPVVYEAHISRDLAPGAELSIDLGGLRVLSL